MSVKSPITQKYDMKSMGSASRSLKGGMVRQNYPRNRLNAFGSRGSHADNNTPNQVPNSTSYGQPILPDGASPLKHQTLLGSNGR